MSLTRRRFLSISAAALALPFAAPARAASWSGVALGAEARVTLRGPDPEAALAEVRRIVEQVEQVFSLYRDGSDLVRLNRTGRLAPLPAMLAEVCAMTDLVHDATGGAFDPTVQALWQGAFEGRDRRGDLGWQRVRRAGGALTLAPGQALTFNGIAQGFATDLATRALAARGYGHALVNIGEHRALGGPFVLELADPEHGPMGTRRLEGGAIATSSPGALRLPDGRTHVMNPLSEAPSRWSTVSVEAESAALADAVSTAACLMDRDAIRAAIRRLPGIARVTLVTTDGALRSLT